MMKECDIFSQKIFESLISRKQWVDIYLIYLAMFNGA